MQCGLKPHTKNMQEHKFNTVIMDKTGNTKDSAQITEYKHHHQVSKEPKRKHNNHEVVKKHFNEILINYILISLCN
jgi:hypothetical protein